MGYNLAAVCYLSMASELSGEAGRSRTIAVMWFMMIVGIILTAVGLSYLVDPYTAAALKNSFWIVGLGALFLGLLGLVRLEPRSVEMESAGDELSWLGMARVIKGNRQAAFFFWYLIILLAALLGQDILLEPYGGEAFGMTVRETTRITSLWGGMVLLAFIAAGALDGKLAKKTVARLGGWSAVIGFVLIAVSGLLSDLRLFYSGIVLLGFGTGLSTVSNLGIMLDMTIAGSVGLFIGVWGMASAISRLMGSVLGGAVRDVITQVSQNPLAGYIVVFAIEAGFLLVSLLMLRKVNVQAFHKDSSDAPSMVEKAAIAGDL
jgi:BCD family chlorophyll transporter-like MFS transporter